MARKKKLSDKDISPKFYELLGRVCVRWAFIDVMIGEFFTWIVDGDKGAMMIVTQNVASNTLTDWLRTLVPVRFKNNETLLRLSDLFLRIDHCRAERNRIVHGLWTSGEDDNSAMLQTIRWERAEIIRNEFVTIPDLNDLLGDIIEIGAELLFLGNQLGFHPQIPNVKDANDEPKK